jgi:dihydrofolate reductase
VAVRLFMSMSLDGFVADRSGNATALYPDLGDLRNTEALSEMIEATAAVVMGRRSYDMGATDEGEDQGDRLARADGHQVPRRELDAALVQEIR